MEIGKTEMYVRASLPSLVIIYDFTIGNVTYVHVIDKNLENNEIEIVPLDYVYKHLPGDWTPATDDEGLPLIKATREDVKDLNVKFFLKEDSE